MKRAATPTAATAAGLALVAWLAAAGCLNPRPEELPSNEPVPGLSGNPDEGEGDGAYPNDPGLPTTPTDEGPDAPASPGASETPSSEGEPEPQNAPDAGPSDAGPPASRAAEPPPQTEASDPG